MSLFGSSTTKNFDKILEKATSPLLLQQDWESILQLCDIVKSQNVPAKYAVQGIKKKFGHENDHVVLNSLYCLESIMKNCGGAVHKEVASRDMIEALGELAKNRSNPIRDKILELIQCWSHGLGQQHKTFTETYNLFTAEGYHFPPLKESEAMFENSDIAPEWRDDKECFRCRQLFTTFIRKHHCRACGDIFCDKCSSKQCSIPKYGIDQNVRVCDACYEKLTSGSSITAPVISKPASSSRATPANASAPNQTKTQAELDEEESYQLALAISQSEADEKERQKKLLTQKYALSSFMSTPTSTTNNTNNHYISNTDENNEEYAELNKYIKRGQEHKSTELSTVSNGHEIQPITKLPNDSNNFISDSEIDQFTNVVTDHINNFKFRMLSNQQRGRSITTDTAVQSVFVMLQHFYPNLQHYMQLLEEKRAYYENLQDKLNQLKDAREALNALRAEHYERKQREALERDRQRQIQLAQKLDFMRQKKQEYLEYQRQIHLQRLAQQELEMKARLEQQRQLTLAREQIVQNPQLSMIPTDYSQITQQNLSYQIPYASLPMQQYSDPQNPYASITQLPAQQPVPLANYPPTMMYQPNFGTNPTIPQTVSFPLPIVNGENMLNPGTTGQLAMTNVNVPYPQQQQPTQVVNQEKSEQQLIIFD